jgi:hypothetical protein
MLDDGGCGLPTGWRDPDGITAGSPAGTSSPAQAEMASRAGLYRVSS